ncbi:MAG: hypothetical protein RSC29_03205, partial [Oscillospiraceae bacterium]
MKFKKIFSMLIVVTFAAGLYIPSGVQGAENLSIEATSIESEEVNQSIIEENLNDKAEDPIVTAVTGFDEDVASVTLESILGKNPAANSITENLNISTDETLKNGTKITWESNMHGAIAGDAYKQRTARGKVTRHPESDRNVTLTAKFKSSDNSLTETKTFDFVVLKETEAPKVIIDETYDNLTSAELSKMGFEEIDSGKVNDDDSSFGEIKLSGNQLVLEKTNSATSQSYGVRKNFTYYEDAYDNDSDRTAVWANKLKGIYDVEWDASYENIKGNRVTERIVGKVGGGIGPVALIIVKNTEAFYTYNNYINAPKKRDLFFAGNPMNGINRKIRIIPDIQSFEMFLNNKTVPEDTTEVTSNPRNAFNTTGWTYRNSVQYIDGFTWTIAREEGAGAAVKPKKLKVTEVKKQPDLVVEGAIEQLTMDSVTDAPADVKTIKALPATLNEAKITWTSSNSEVIEILDGVATVKKPTQDTDVILTANVLNNADGFDKNKEFKLTVKAPLMDNKQEFDTDVASITIESLLGENLDKNNIKTNLVFSDSSFLYGTKVA